MNRKWKTGLKVFVAAAVVSFLGWARSLIIRHDLERRAPEVEDAAFASTDSSEVICEWRFPETNGTPASSVIFYSPASRSPVRCCRIEGDRVVQYHVSGEHSFYEITDDVQGGGKNWKSETVPTNIAHVSVQSQMWENELNPVPLDPATSSHPKWTPVFRKRKAVFTIAGAPPEIHALWEAVSACLNDAGSAQRHSSFLRFQSVTNPPSELSPLVIDVPSFCGSGWMFHFKQRDVLRFFWWKDNLIPIAQGIDPFICINQKYSPGSSLILEYRYLGKSTFRRVDVYAGNAESTTCRRLADSL
jgi:hypothetical protein